MFGIRQKLMMGFGGLLSIFIVIGTVTIFQIDDLGGAIDVILRENYQSVIACQNMKEALERIDSGVLFSLSGQEEKGRRYISENIPKFHTALLMELQNITIAGEGEKAKSVKTLFGKYKAAVTPIISSQKSLEMKRTIYYSTLLPIFLEIKSTTQAILVMNQANMMEAKETARREAASAHRRIFLAILACVILSVLWSLGVRHWILEPIHKLIEAADEIRDGNLELVLKSNSRDEIGQLSESFNSMAEGLRWIRRSDRMDLLRSRHMTDEVFKALPSAIAVLNIEGRVEVSTQSARDLFGLKPGVLIKELNLNWLHNLVRLAMDENRKAEIDSANSFIQQFLANNEYFFQPVAVPMHTETNREEITGVIVVFKDVTQLHEQQELKRSVVSTISHQLKTPLTSLRISVHLLLEEQMGTLNEKQTDLLMTAREDSERLSTILDDLLDLNRIESGKALLNIKPTSVHSLINDAVESFSVDARDKGIVLEGTVTDYFPEVLADAALIHHVFANLISNALRFTDAGGSITIGAEDKSNSVCFCVRDTGKGIPKDYLNFLFNQFYRVPGQKDHTGVGLGLAIVKQIITAHGGKVGAESASGKGANFWFTLPKADNDNKDKNSTEKDNQRRK